MLSQYTDEQQMEDLSRNYIERFFIKKGWKFRKNDLDNDIDFEVEIFNNNITTVKFFKAQLKSEKDPDISVHKKIVRYDCPVKFLRFAEICDFPVFIFLYDGSGNEKGYWLWVQDYIFKHLDSDSPNWRNQTKARLKFKLVDEVTEDRSFYDQLEDISNKGINEMIQRGKIGNVKDFYYTMKEDEDSRNSYLTLQRKILVDYSISTSKEAMKQLINDSYKDLIHKYEAIFTDYYNDIRQLNFGSPFCRTITNSDNINSEDFGVLLDSNDSYENVSIEWIDSHTAMLHLIKSKEVGKSEFLNYSQRQRKLINEFAKQFFNLLNNLDSGKTNKEDFIKNVKNIKAYEHNFNDIENVYFKEDGYPPNDCIELRNVLNNTVFNFGTVIYNIDDINSENVREGLKIIKEQLKSLNEILNQ
ncbi:MULTISPECIES: DUF4365 domain-containing protein [Priestia]|uniref:DUF4365 domain-containing protein n=1 Tax=Priestia TaxID=2800373 RepID=UPI00390CC065